MEVLDDDYISDPDNLLDIVSELQYLERLGYELEPHMFDSTVTIDIEVLAIYEPAWREFNRKRCRDYRSGLLKRNLTPGRKAYLKQKECKGCRKPFQPRNQNSEYCSKQCFAQKNALYLTIDGERKTVKEWSSIGGMSVPAIKSRLARGWAQTRDLIYPTDR